MLKRATCDTPNFVNTGRVGFSRSLTGQQFGQIRNGTNYFTQFGLTGLNPPPRLSGAGRASTRVATLGPSGSPLSAKQNMFEYSDEVNWNHGKHSFFFGGEFDLIDYNAVWYTGSPNGGLGANGEYTYNGNATGLPYASTKPAWQNPRAVGRNGNAIPYGNDLADYLLGDYVSTSASAGSQVGYFHQNNIMPYFQDDWKISEETDAEPWHAL
jgi:hypothetical protein